MEVYTVITVPLSHRIGPDDDILFTETLFAWDQTPPQYSNQPPNSNPHSFWIGHHEILKRLGIQTLCELPIDLKGVPRDQLITVSGPTAAPYLEIKYDLVVTILPEKMLFRILFDGEKYANSSVKTTL